MPISPVYYGPPDEAPVNQTVAIPNHLISEVDLDTDPPNLVGIDETVRGTISAPWTGTTLEGDGNIAPNTSTTVDVSGATDGEVVFIIGTIGDAQTAPATFPAGWTVNSFSEGTSGASSIYACVAWKVKQAGDTTISVSWPVSARWQFTPIQWAGVDPANPIEGPFWVTHTSGASYPTGVGAPGADNRWAVAMAFSRGSTAIVDWTVDAATTDRANFIGTTSPFQAISVADTNGVASYGSHVYTPTGQTASHGIGGLMYLIPKPVGEVITPSPINVDLSGQGIASAEAFGTPAETTVGHTFFPVVPTAANGRILFSKDGNTQSTKTSPDLANLVKYPGDLLIAIVWDYGTNLSPSIWGSWGGGFTEFGDFGASGQATVGMAYKWSDGTETGTFTVTQAGVVGGDAAMCVMSISGAHLTTPPEVGGYAVGTNGMADSGSLTPASWNTSDPENTLWITCGMDGRTGADTLSAWTLTNPTNYTGIASSGVTRDQTGGIEMAVAFRQNKVATEDPAAFTNDNVTTRWGAVTIAVRTSNKPSLVPSGVPSGEAIGTPTITASGGAQTVSPTAIGSAEAFGTVVFSTPITVSPTAIGSSEAFGTVVLSTPITVSPTAIASAEAFGTLVISSPITVSPTGIASAEAFGTLVANVKWTLSPTAIGSAEAFGTTSVSFVTNLSPTGIGSAEAFGTPTLSMVITISPTGIASAEAFGTVSITGAITVSPTGIASGEGVGTPTITTLIAISPTGIASGESFGVAAISTTIVVSPTGIASGETFGTLAINNIRTLSPTGIGSGEALGNPVLSMVVVLSPTGISSAEVFGTTTLSLLTTLSPTGLASAEAFGNPTLSMVIVVSPTGIATAEAFGTLFANVIWTLSPTGISSAEAFGTVVISAIKTVSPTGIASAEAFGNPTLAMVIALAPTGIASGEAFGTVVVTRLVTLSPTGIGSAETFGNPTITALIVLSPTGISSGESFGTVVLSAVILLSPTGIGSAETFGTLSVTRGPVTVSPQGISSGEALGNPVVSSGALVVVPTGIPSAESVSPVTVTTSVLVIPVGILSGELFGLTHVIPGPRFIVVVGIPSQEGFGQPNISMGTIVIPSAENTRTNTAARINGRNYASERTLVTVGAGNTRSEARNV